MNSRLLQLARHFSRPRPNLGYISTANPRLHVNSVASRIMASAPASAGGSDKRLIQTAACLIIGDEVLGGKTVDTNSSFMAKWCFDLGVDLKRIETIQDEEDEIIEAVRRMSDRYDFVVTSGGIGPTHDDITYKSIAKAFGLPLKLHNEAYERMKKLSDPKKSEPGFSWDVESPTKTARLRMVYLPTDESRDLDKQAIFPHHNMWVPVSVVNGNIHILPGVPGLFKSLLDGLTPFLASQLEGKGTCRVIISTSMSESVMAAYLTELAAKVAPKGVKVGSYPRYKKNNSVTLVGRDSEYIESLVPEVVANLKGKRVDFEGQDDKSEEP
ncbi:molybdopterin binding domain-containing protein [Nemania abortiva]|nr:molybdopterin binding domain-containing protein [Nemania abortiva]